MWFDSCFSGNNGVKVRAEGELGVVRWPEKNKQQKNCLCYGFICSSSRRTSVGNPTPLSRLLIVPYYIIFEQQHLLSPLLCSSLPTLTEFTELLLGLTQSVWDLFLVALYFLEVSFGGFRVLLSAFFWSGFRAACVTFSWTTVAMWALVRARLLSLKLLISLFFPVRSSSSWLSFLCRHGDWKTQWTPVWMWRLCWSEMIFD